jgi:hypothetical protein
MKPPLLIKLLGDQISNSPVSTDSIHLQAMC